MLFFEKDGIVFAFVQKRFASFEQMTPLVRLTLRYFPSRPVIIVFPEAVLETNEVHRKETKEWIRTIEPLLSQHGNGRIFFSIIERGARKSFTNTGYLIEPLPSNAQLKTRNWKAYPKLAFTTLERNLSLLDTQFKKRWKRRNRRLAPLSPKEEKILEDLESRWETGNTEVPQGRAMTGVLQATPIRRTFAFPRTIIHTSRGPKTVELRVCSDIQMFSKAPRSDILIVPAMGIWFSIKFAKNSFVRNLEKNGFVAINDVSGAGNNPRFYQRKYRSALKPSYPKRIQTQPRRKG